MTRIILFLISAFLIIPGEARSQYCTNDSRYTDAQFFESNEITVGTNIQFGTAPDFKGNPYPLFMDLYYPNLVVDQSPKRPFIMLFHGGGFSSGDKQSGDIRDLCFHLALRGFVCASVNYRLGYDFSEYGQYKARYRAIQDGNAALRFIVNNANTVRIDTSWLFVGGQSAGSLLALGMVYADQSELDSISLLYNTTAISVELGNIQASGNSLLNTYSIKGIFNNWGGVTKSEVDFNEMIPTIAFHGELDSTVAIDSDNSFANYTLKGSRAIHYELVARNICSELTVDKTGGHGIFRNESSSFRAQRASCFFKSVFCNKCSSFYTTDSIPSNCSLPVSVNELNFDSNIKAYPNPISTFLIVKEYNVGITQYSIISIYGQIVQNGTIKSERIDISYLPVGLYYLQIGNHAEKFMVVR